MSESGTDELNIPDVAKALMADLGPQSLGMGPGAWTKFDLELISNVKVTLKVSLGEVETTIGQLFSMKPGAVLSLDKSVNDPVEIFVDGKLIARGEIVVVGDRYGVRIVELSSQN